LRPTPFSLPEAPKVSIDNMLTPDPSAIANSMVTGLAGAGGSGSGSGFGLGGSGGKGLGTGINFLGIKASGQRIVLLFDVSGSVVNKANASSMPLLKIKEETEAMINKLPADSRFNIIQFVRNYKSFQSELVPVAVERARAMPQPHDRALADRPRTSRLFGDERATVLAIPFLRMLHVEHRVQREVVPFLGRNAEAAQPLVAEARTRRGRHLDDAERADRMKRIAAEMRQRDHGVTERERFRHDGFGRRGEAEIAGKALQHRTMHSLGAAAARQGLTPMR
jgi:hypothetical protein